MKIVLFQIVEAITHSPPDKLNVLGLGVRRFVAPSFPTFLNAVLVIQAEASMADIGAHRLRVALDFPDGKRRVIADGPVEIEERPGIDLRRPLILGAEVPLQAIPLEMAGAHRFRVTLGRVRAEYRFVIDALEPSQAAGSEPSPKVGED